MQPYRVETTISPDRLLIIRGLPFRVGERVEVIVLSLPRKRKREERYPLRGKAIRYIAPFDSVAEKDWNVLR
jgi:hypothetical protein